MGTRETLSTSISTVASSTSMSTSFLYLSCTQVLAPTEYYVSDI